MATGKRKQNERLNASQVFDEIIRDSDFKLSKFNNSESEDNVDNVHNVQDEAVDQAAEDGAGNQGLLVHTVKHFRIYQVRK